MPDESEVARRRRELQDRKIALAGLQSSRSFVGRPELSSASRPRAQLPRAATFTGKSLPRNASDVRSPTRHISEAPPTACCSAVCRSVTVDIPPALRDVTNGAGKWSMRSELFGEDGFYSDRFDGGAVASGEGEGAQDGEIAAQGSRGGGTRADDALSFRMNMSSEKWSKSRPVHALRFHRKYEDVLFSAYGARGDGQRGDPDGAVGVWSLTGGSQQDSVLQRVLTTSAPTTALALPSLSPTLVLGGTYLGGIVLWDTRTKSSLPVQRCGSSSLDLAHQHGRQPVFSIATPSSSSPMFVSASTGGQVCIWTLSNLERPVGSFIVHDSLRTTDVTVSALAMPRTARLLPDSGVSGAKHNSLFAGSLDGGIYRFEGQGSTWKLDSGEVGHQGPVTSIAAHPAGARWAPLDDIVLSSSMDWKIGLRSVRRGQRSLQLKTFDVGVPAATCDVQWSEKHPTLFCVGDEAGGVSLIDVRANSSSDTGSRRWRFVAPKQDTSSSCPAAINRVRWSTTGGHIVAGNSEGNISLWSSGPLLDGLPDADWMANYCKELCRRASASIATGNK